MFDDYNGDDKHAPLITYDRGAVLLHSIHSTNICCVLSTRETVVSKQDKNFYFPGTYFLVGVEKNWTTGK